MVLKIGYAFCKLKNYLYICTYKEIDREKIATFLLDINTIFLEKNLGDVSFPFFLQNNS